MTAFSTVCPSAKDRSREAEHSERKSDWGDDSVRSPSIPAIAGGSPSDCSASEAREEEEDDLERVEREEEE